MRAAPAVSCASAALCWVGAVAFAAPGAPGNTSSGGESIDAGSASRSLGWPWRGDLRHGVKLKASSSFRYAEDDAPEGHFYGTGELVGLLERTLKKVGQSASGTQLVVGELSRRGGGRILGHRSHENGRDADVGFYLTDDGEPVQADDFVRVNWRGQARMDDRIVEFDARRNWALINALLHDRRTTVQHVFVARTVRRLLLREARKQGASAALLERAEHVILPPGVRHPHRNHYHIRVYCSADDVPGCHDKGPFWPWIPSEHPFSERRSPRFHHIDP